MASEDIGIGFDELEGMSYNYSMKRFGISENQACDSELDGSSDAGDGFPTRSTPRASRARKGRSSVDDDNMSSSSGDRTSSEASSSSASTTTSGVSDPEVTEEDEEINDRPRISFQEDEVGSDTEESAEEGGQYTPVFHKGSGGKKIAEKFKRSYFNESFGLKATVNTDNIVNIFYLFFTEGIIDFVIKQSNLYATQKGHTLDLTKEEFSSFLGILIIMGFHQLPSLRLYWSSHKFYNVPAISSIMSLRRFLTILRYLHLNDNSQMPARGSQEFDRLYKIRPWLNHFNEVFKSVFNPSRFLAVDESMITFKGSSSLKQYMPMKPIKRGFKVWAICCSVTGYLLGFEFYEGKNGPTRTTYLGEEVVLNLTTSFQNLGYCVFFDRFFSPFSLIKKLLGRGLYACATILQSEKIFPQNLLKTDKEMKCGEMDQCYTNDFGLVKWKDRGTKCVTTVSSMDNPSETTMVKRKNKEGEKIDVCCPNAIITYNKYMGGVDLFDQYMAYYSVQWKSRRWWMKAFYYFLDAAAVNSYIIYKEEIKKIKTKKPISQLSFRACLAEELIGGFQSRSTPPRKVTITRNKFSSKRQKLDVTMPHGHLPIKGKLRRCAHCSTKAKPVKSSYVCQDCDVALCIKSCFKEFHENLK